MPQDSHGERRGPTRFSICLEAEYSASQASPFTQTRTYDISANGMCISSREEIVPGTLLNIRLQVPDSVEQLILKAQAVWCKRDLKQGFKSGLALKECAIKPVPIVLKALSKNS